MRFMGFIEKLKLLFKVRQPATDLINEVQAVKSGWKTIPFWITLLGTLLSLIASLQGIIPGKVGLIITTVLTSFYNVLRGATKTDVSGTKPFFQTSEFWIGVGGQLTIALSSLKAGGIDTTWMAAMSSILATAMGAAQNLAAQQPTPPTAPAA